MLNPIYVKFALYDLENSRYKAVYTGVSKLSNRCVIISHERTYYIKSRIVGNSSAVKVAYHAGA